MGILNKLVTSLVPGAPPLEKAWKEIPQTAAERQPIALMEDPMGLSYSMGYKDRKTSMTYDILRQVSHQLSIISAIINTRINQVAAFSSPFRRTRTLGFEIKHKDRDHKLSKSEKKYISELENFVSFCGKPMTNPYYFGKRDNFDQFTRKVLRDRLIYDGMAWEVVPDRRGNPFEFLAVDASTIRLAVPPHLKKKKLTQREFANIKPYVAESDTLDSFEYPRSPIITDPSKEAAAYVQVWQGSIKRAFLSDELSYSVANPRTDIRTNGYGYSEIEQLINTITSQLWAEEYNRNFFKQGAAPKGILNIRGDNIAPEQLEAFRRAWTANVSGVENAWRTPVLQSEEIQYINMQSTNMEMEYSRWMEYLIKLICGVYLIAPEEIGFSFTAGGMQQPMVETGNEWKLKASKDRGLRPLLKFYADAINRSILDPIDDKFYLDFIGLDELTERERIELRQQQVQFFRTVNEIRLDEDLEPLEDGDIVMNPAYLQYIQMQHQWKTEKRTLDMQQKQMQEQQQMQQKQMQMQEQAVKAQMGGPEGAPPGGAPPEGGPPEGGPPGGAPPEGGPPGGAPPEGAAAAMAAAGGEEAAAGGEEAAAGGEEAAAGGEEVTQEDVNRILSKVPDSALKELTREG